MIAPGRASGPCFFVGSALLARRAPDPNQLVGAYRRTTITAMACHSLAKCMLETDYSANLSLECDQ